MKRLAVALFLSLPIAACTQPAPLDVKDAWTRATAANTTTAAIYMTITSPTPDRLLTASAPVAKKTDLMTMETAPGGAMGMKYLDGIEIPAGKPVSLNATGLHVWLADLNQPLKAGESFPLTLKFEKAGERQVTVAIREAGAAGPMSGMGM